MAYPGGPAAGGPPPTMTQPGGPGYYPGGTGAAGVPPTMGAAGGAAVPPTGPITNQPAAGG